MPRPRVHDNVPQEIVCTVINGSPDAIELMKAYLLDKGMSEDRFQSNWDTWRGTTYSPPNDALPWTREELDQITTLLEAHPNTVHVDSTPGSGSGG